LGSGCGITVQQIYDGKGRAYRTSLPYNTCTGEAEHFVTTLYDGANRPISVATDDGSATTTTYSGNQTTVTDAASASRTITTDGLGRLKSVVETIAPTPYTTSYTYDVLDDLLTVTQGSLPQRMFTYDAMKRLVTATNPENGQICYGTLSGTTCTENYDSNGNLLSRADNAGVTTSYTYDKLNRMFTKSYSDGATPPVTFAYDGTGSGVCATSSYSYNIGRLTSVSTQALGSAPATQQLTSYDALGRACSSSQTVASAGPYSFTYQYNLASGLKTETYPSGRVVTTSPFDLLNRPTGLGSTLGSYASTYVASAGYASNDALNGLTLGPSTATPLGTQSITFDPVRQQPTTITVANPSATQLTLHYFYCPSSGTSCSTNNGNVQSAGIVVPSPNALNLTQNFSYDTVNRLISAQETGGTDDWNQAYGYDQWGNRAVSGNYIPNTYATPSALSQYTNNQWLGPGASYDSKGNQKSLPSRTFTYDAENRLVASTQPGMGAISYVYDGDGRRVQKTVVPAVTTYVYDAGGQLTAEYSTAAPAAGGTEYLMADALGSTRIVLDAAGTVKERIDYLPFGEEIATPIGGRAAPYTAFVYPTNPDIEAQKFTGKERDAETGLDYFGARYMSAAQGRFTSPDPVGGNLLDPQTLNRYAYVRNNPLVLTDPTGMYTCSDSKDCSSDRDKKFEVSLASLRGKDGDVGRAAGAYGDRNKDNGVTVGFADLSTKGENGKTVSTIGTDADGNLRANSAVTINTKISGDDFTATIGHEGSHAADAQDVVKSGITGGLIAGQEIHAGMNITPYQSEQRAYGVTNAILSLENQSHKYDCGSTTCILGRNSGMPSQLPGVIDQIVAHNPVYNQGGQPMSSTNQGASVVNGVTPIPPKAAVPH
jgi:RHS repeat-associated protein